MMTEYLLEKREQYVYLAIKGTYELAQVQRYGHRIVEICENENMYRILVDALRVEGTDLSTMERFFVGELIAKLLPPKIKIAVVWPAEHINNFAETVAVNRGGFIKVFPDIESAERWLITAV